MTGEFKAALQSGRFLVTTEEAPPKGADLTRLLQRTALLEGWVDGVNLTESSSAVMTMSPIGVVPSLIAQGLDPILQITCRDRNRIALQADLLAAAALRVTSVVCMAGDEIDEGDQPGAKAVFDLDTPGLLRMATELTRGRDMAGRSLAVAPSFVLGAVANPGAADLDLELRRMELKAEAGAQFFQTQAVYEPAAFERFMLRAGRLGRPVLAGYIVPKSGDMARRLNQTLTGVQIPQALIDALDASDDKAATSIELSGGILARLRPLCQGLHVIAVGWESKLPEILTAAGIDRAQDPRTRAR